MFLAVKTASMNRRKFLKSTAIFGAALGLPVGLYTCQPEPHWLEFVKIRMPIRNLPDHPVGKIFMQVSDIHVGDRVDSKHLIRSLRKA